MHMFHLMADRGGEDYETLVLKLIPRTGKSGDYLWGDENPEIAFRKLVFTITRDYPDVLNELGWFEEDGEWPEEEEDEILMDQLQRSLAMQSHPSYTRPQLTLIKGGLEEEETT